MVGLYGIFPLVCYTVGAILFSRFKLDEAAYRQIRAELDAREPTTRTPKSVNR